MLLLPNFANEQQKKVETVEICTWAVTLFSIANKKIPMVYVNHECVFSLAIFAGGYCFDQSKQF
jgi:hypothetical protein